MTQKDQGAVSQPPTAGSNKLGEEAPRDGREVPVGLAEQGPGIIPKRVDAGTRDLAGQEVSQPEQTVVAVHGPRVVRMPVGAVDGNDVGASGGDFH